LAFIAALAGQEISILEAILLCLDNAFSHAEFPVISVIRKASLQKVLRTMPPINANYSASRQPIRPYPHFSISQAKPLFVIDNTGSGDSPPFNLASKNNRLS
jgi:hypothetical protein